MAAVRRAKTLVTVEGSEAGPAEGGSRFAPCGGGAVFSVGGGLMATGETSPSLVYGAALLMRLGS